MAPPRRAVTGVVQVHATDAPAWVGKALIAAIRKSPDLHEPLVRLIQEHVGPGLTLELITSLNEADCPLCVTVKKREVSEEHKKTLIERLKKAREVKQLKRSVT